MLILYQVPYHSSQICLFGEHGKHPLVWGLFRRVLQGEKINASFVDRLSLKTLKTAACEGGGGDTKGKDGGSLRGKAMIDLIL